MPDPDGHPGDFDVAVEGLIVAGSGAASGRTDDAPYPGGSLALQAPHFAAAGIDLTGYHLGTLNVDISPHVFVPIEPPVTIKDVRWTDAIPAETFSFFRCRIEVGSTAESGLVYRPHPETKVEHFHDPALVEVIARWIADADVGMRVRLQLRSSEAIVPVR